MDERVYWTTRRLQMREGVAGPTSAKLRYGLTCSFVVFQTRLRSSKNRERDIPGVANVDGSSGILDTLVVASKGEKRE